MKNATSQLCDSRSFYLAIIIFYLPAIIPVLRYFVSLGPEAKLVSINQISTLYSWEFLFWVLLQFLSIFFLLLVSAPGRIIDQNLHVFRCSTKVYAHKKQ